jgi:hypothetical protein
MGAASTPALRKKTILLERHRCLLKRESFNHAFARISRPIDTELLYSLDDQTNRFPGLLPWFSQSFSTPLN